MIIYKKSYNTSETLINYNICFCLCSTCFFLQNSKKYSAYKRVDEFTDFENILLCFEIGNKLCFTNGKNVSAFCIQGCLGRILSYASLEGYKDMRTPRILFNLGGKASKFGKVCCLASEQPNIQMDINISGRFHILIFFESEEGMACQRLTWRYRRERV